MNAGIPLSQLNQQVRQVVKSQFTEPVWIIAEISELKVNATGHCYLELVEKDFVSEKIIARARATIWSYTFRILKPYFETTTHHSLAPGIKVLLRIQVEFHELYGFSLNILDIDPSYTLGDMARKRLETIRRLEEEGVLEMNHELIFPLVPQRIAVISSETAAGFQDFMHELQENTGGYSFQVQLFPALMQGDEAVASIIAALDKINDQYQQFDLLAIIRGGGAVAELSIFDDYWLAYHIAQFPLPVLTGIGHEKDMSVADLVAHQHFKTPTAVASFLVDRLTDFERTLEEKRDDFVLMVQAFIESARDRLVYFSQHFPGMIQESVLAQKRALDRTELSCIQKVSALVHLHHRKLNQLPARIEHSASRYFGNQHHHLGFQLLVLKNVYHSEIREAEHRLILAEKTFQLLDPVKILGLGYALVKVNGKRLRNVSDIQIGDEMETLLSDGSLYSIIKGKDKQDPMKNES